MRKPSRDIADLLAIMARLRSKDGGCPWDLDQDFASIAPYTIEEAYEVVDAIERGDLADLKDELGDLLLQVVFHARMAEEQGAFDFPAVVEAVTAKLIRRHPHVFGEVRDLAPDAVTALWARIKADEKSLRARERAAAGLAPEKSAESVLDGVPPALPALTRALKLQEKAGRVGFDWNDARQVLAKIREECDEIDAELARGDRDATAAEIGDLLFAAVNLARHAGADPETALRATNAKFVRRFAYVEAALRADGRTPEGSCLKEMDRLWTQAKITETGGAGS